MRRRARLTKYLRRRLADVPHPLPQSLTPEEQAYYLQGTFFNTAVVQMSEAMAHLLLIIAQRPEVQNRLVEQPDDDAYLDQVIDEGLREYPLFGIAHRITTADIELRAPDDPGGDGAVLPATTRLTPDSTDRWRRHQRTTSSRSASRRTGPARPAAWPR